MPCNLLLCDISCCRHFTLFACQCFAEDHADASFSITIFKLFLVAPEKCSLLSERNNKAVVVHLKGNDFGNQLSPDRIAGVDCAVFFVAQGAVHAAAFIKAVSTQFIVGAKNMRQLVQQDVIERCRSAFNIRAQEDAVHAVFPFANKSGGMKIKIAFLFVTVSQAIRKILLAELLEDFLLVTRLKAGQYKVFLVERFEPMRSLKISAA